MEPTTPRWTPAAVNKKKKQKTRRISQIEIEKHHDEDPTKLHLAKLKNKIKCKN